MHFINKSTANLNVQKPPFGRFRGLFRGDSGVGFILLILLQSITLNAQQHEQAFKILKKRGEICFSFQENEKHKLNQLSRIVSLDKKQGDSWIAYANETEFTAFLQKGYFYKILTGIATKSNHIAMATTIGEMGDWDKYPTYSVYLQMMQHFAQNYPDLCRIDTIGYSVNDRLILVAEISSNIQKDAAKPQFFYSSTMHGDELTGFIFMLRLTDYLLKNYGQNQYITNLLENVHICVNPLSNPDGAYRKSDNDVSGATRYNANNIDLNRNYPNPFSDDRNLVLQKENQEMIAYLSKKRFTLSANLHGGAEVMNYPWDMYDSYAKKPADDNWWAFIAQNYVDTCRKVSGNIFVDVTSSGVTEGGDWYVIDNGRQDYVNAFFKCREMTMEISSIKTPDSDSLNSYWNIQYKSLLQYIGQIQYGIRGCVVDSATLQPLDARIFILNHDKDSSHVYSFLPFGDFYRPVKGGTYSIKISKDGYISKTIENISLSDFEAKILDTIKLQVGEKSGISFFKMVEKKCSVSRHNEKLQVTSTLPISNIELYEANGRKLSAKRYENVFQTYIRIPKSTVKILLIKISFSDQTFETLKISL